MVRQSFEGREIAQVLRRHGYKPVDRTGSHLKLRWESADTDEVRVVTIPMHPGEEIPTGTLRSIAEQCGAVDFEAWCAWIAANC